MYFHVNKKKWIRTLVSIVILSLLFLSPRLVSEARAETRITITIAAGGVACGIYFFVHYAFRASMSIEQKQTETTAMFNLGPEGWQIQFPALNLIGNGNRSVTFLVHSPEAVQMDVLKWRF
ncbi:hypothetical protein D4R89_02500 [bacterium]|nr:MAG: hypothetical protein D4R89_02500 [bacterium]